MRNYFSQLAKQSGLRPSGQSEKTRDAEKSTLAPLHQERTLMIAPHSHAVKSSETLTVKSPATPLKQTPIKVAETKLENIERVPTENIVTVKLEAKKTFPKSTDFETTVESSHVDVVGISPPEEKSAEAQAFEPPTVEQTFFVEPDAPQTSEFRESSQSDEGKTSDKNVAPPPVNPQYFQKTTEILEKGSDATPLEIQQILLQEVRQWAAETPDFPEIETEIVEAKQPTVKIVPPPITEESIVVRENSALRGDENQGLEEQNLSLSIGTISIVVEDASPPTTENVSVVRSQSENRGGEAKRRFSSLRRHYL